MGLSTQNCSVSNATLNRFFSLHYILPFVLAALAVAHMIAQFEGQ
jgi:ubiquinol-cytochrome c reductase cytochrome b subunit